MAPAPWQLSSAHLQVQGSTNPDSSGEWPWRGESRPSPGGTPDSSGFSLSTTSGGHLTCMTWSAFRTSTGHSLRCAPRRLPSLAGVPMPWQPPSQPRATHSGTGRRGGFHFLCWWTDRSRPHTPGPWQNSRREPWPVYYTWWRPGRCPAPLWCSRH